MTEQEKQAHKAAIEAIRQQYDDASHAGTVKMRNEHPDYHFGVKQYWVQEVGASKAIPALIVAHKQDEEDMAAAFKTMLDGYVTQFERANPGLKFWYTGANVKEIPVAKAGLVSLKGDQHATGIYHAPGK